MNIVGTMAVFFETEKDIIFRGLVNIGEEETAKQALVRAGVDDFGPGGSNITFKTANRIKRFALDHHPLVRIEPCGINNWSYTKIGHCVFIEEDFAQALRMMELDVLWGEDSYVFWPQEVVGDFSAHLHNLCEKHEIDPPVRLE